MEQFNELTNYLKNNLGNLKYDNRDGRVNSIINEEFVLNKLFEKYKIEKPKIRNWYDFKIGEYFFNIKISSFSSADNISSKKSMAYTLTGIEGDEFSDKWNLFHEKLFDNININNSKDYYFLCINSADTNDIFWTSLKRINTLIPNGNNLPFQCNWNNNKVFSNRSNQEAIDYIISVYLQSWEKKISPYNFLTDKVDNYYNQEG